MSGASVPDRLTINPAGPSGDRRGDAPSAAGACRVDVVSDERGFFALEPEWNALAARAGLDHPFLEHAWVRTWWECFGAGRRLHILVVRQGSDVVGIAPLALDITRLCGMRMRRIGLLANVHTPRCDVLVAPPVEPAYDALWAHLAARSEPWDVLELRQLPEGSRTPSELGARAARDRHLVGTWRSADSPYVTLGGGWDRHFMSLSHNHRARMRKSLRRLERRGEVALKVVTAEDRLEDALEAGLGLEAVEWKRRRGTAILCSPVLRRFYARVARVSARRGTLKLFFLCAGGTPIAFSYALCHANKLYVLKGGYDPAHAAYSPYHLLTWLILQDASRRGLDEYDFLGGRDDWKLHWTREFRPHVWLYVLPDTLRGRALHWLKFGPGERLRRRPLLRVLRDAAGGRRDG